MSHKDISDPVVLEPCPFCGESGASVRLPTCTRSSAYDAADRAYPEVVCEACHASAPGKNWDARGDTAIGAWNRRAHPAPESAKVGETPLTREQIEEWREFFQDQHIRDEGELDTLCNMALCAIELATAKRDALEQAAKVADRHINVGAAPDAYACGYADAALNITAAIRAMQAPGAKERTE
jgi:glutamate synthase domain-containing protein 1